MHSVLGPYFARGSFSFLKNENVHEREGRACKKKKKKIYIFQYFPTTFFTFLVIQLCLWGPFHGLKGAIHSSSRFQAYQKLQLS